MSTKAIRESLARWEAIHGHEAPEFVERALAEVEAIEKAAGERRSLSEAISEGDHHALEKLAELACAERNARLAKETT